MTFEVERSFYEQSRAKWLAKGYGGQYAVIKGTKLIGFYSSYTKAFEAGTREADGDFYIERVTPGDEVQIIQRVCWS